MKRTPSWGIVAMLAGGCGGSQAVAPALDDGSSSSTTAAASSESDAETTTGAASTSSSTGDPESSSEESSTGTVEPPPTNVPPPATGIEIVHVTADQGVRVLVARNGELVGGSERTTPLLRNRRLLLRAFYTVDPGFEQRDIYAVATITQADGSTSTYESFARAYERPCEGQELYDCGYGTLSSSFFWLVEAEDVQPGVRYHVELFEVRPGHEHDVSEKIPVFPTDGGSLQIGIEDSYQKMRVMLVPFDHDLGEECPEPPDLLAEFGEDVHGNPRNVAEYFADRLLAENPADEVEVIPHEIVRFTGSLRGTQLLQTLQQLRFAEGAAPEYYYYGVARPCDGGPDFAGVAQLGGPTRGEASQRVGWGVYYQSENGTAGTFVHEIGHEQGRQHIACSGEAGPDLSYPDHPNGRLLSWGADVISNQLAVHDPNDHDYMTYCDSTWVSEWGYNLVAPAIAEISRWEVEGHAAEPEQTLVVGNVNADGTQDWYLTRGHAPPTARTGDGTVLRLRSGSRTLATVPVMAVPWERSSDHNVIAAVPVDLRRVDTLEIDGPLGKLELDPTMLRHVGPATPEPASR